MDGSGRCLMLDSLWRPRIVLIRKRHCIINGIGASEQTKYLMLLSAQPLSLPTTAEWTDMVGHEAGVGMKQTPGHFILPSTHYI